MISSLPIPSRDEGEKKIRSIEFGGHDLDLVIILIFVILIHYTLVKIGGFEKRKNISSFSRVWWDQSI